MMITMMYSHKINSTMRIALVILFCLPFMVMSQDNIQVKGKMKYGDVKTATLLIVTNESDTLKVQIDKKKFKLPILENEMEYQLIFTCGERTKTLIIHPQEGEENRMLYLELDWTDE